MRSWSWDAAADPLGCARRCLPTNRPARPRMRTPSPWRAAAGRVCSAASDPTDGHSLRAARGARCECAAVALTALRESHSERVSCAPNSARSRRGDSRAKVGGVITPTWTQSTSQATSTTWNDVLTFYSHSMSAECLSPRSAPAGVLAKTPLGDRLDRSPRSLMRSSHELEPPMTGVEANDELAPAGMSSRHSTASLRRRSAPIERSRCTSPFPSNRGRCRRRHCAHEPDDHPRPDTLRRRLRFP